MGLEPASPAQKHSDTTTMPPIHSQFGWNFWCNAAERESAAVPPVTVKFPKIIYPKNVLPLLFLAFKCETDQFFGIYAKFYFRKVYQKKGGALPGNKGQFTSVYSYRRYKC